MPGTRDGWLLAVDLDGTLVRRDLTIASEDVAALAHMVADGTPVILATGRFPSDLQEVRQQLGCPLPAACVDGAILLDHDGVCVASHVVTETVVDAFIAHAGALGLRCFAFAEDHLVCAECHADHLAYVTGWARGHRIELRESVGAAASMVLALGDRHDVERLHDALDPGVAYDCFELGTTGMWAGRVRPASVDKGTAVRAWARRLRGDEARIAAVGNDYNDLSLFRVADISFAMADAPGPVRQAATRVLHSDGVRGGGVAEAMAWLREVTFRRS